MSIKYESRTLEWTIIPSICNTSNHRIADGEAGSGKLKDISIQEYRHLTSLTNKDRWVCDYPDPSGTITIELSVSICIMLEKASKIGYLTGDRPKLFQEELYEFGSYISSFMPANGKYFIRLNEASPKDCKYGCGPMTKASEIVTALCTSLRAHRNFTSARHSNVKETLYLVPWRDDWNKYLEFRVFVNERRVTCLSQYIWHQYLGLSHSMIQIVSPRIIEYCNNIAAKHSLPSFVIDVIVVVKDPVMVPDMKIPVIDETTEYNIELVELNPFSAELSSGSALFHWLNDYDIMYGIDKSNVVVRYVVE